MRVLFEVAAAASQPGRCSRATCDAHLAPRGHARRGTHTQIELLQRPKEDIATPLAESRVRQAQQAATRARVVPKNQKNINVLAKLFAWSHER